MRLNHVDGAGTLPGWRLAGFHFFLLWIAAGTALAFSTMLPCLELPRESLLYVLLATSACYLAEGMILRARAGRGISWAWVNIAMSTVFYAGRYHLESSRNVLGANLLAVAFLVLSIVGQIAVLWPLSRYAVLWALPEAANFILGGMGGGRADFFHPGTFRLDPSAGALAFFGNLVLQNVLEGATLLWVLDHPRRRAGEEPAAKSAGPLRAGPAAVAAFGLLLCAGLVLGSKSARNGLMGWAGVFRAAAVQAAPPPPAAAQAPLSSDEFLKRATEKDLVFGQVDLKGLVPAGMTDGGKFIFQGADGVVAYGTSRPAWTAKVPAIHDGGVTVAGDDVFVRAASRWIALGEDGSRKWTAEAASPRETGIVPVGFVREEGPAVVRQVFVYGMGEEGLAVRSLRGGDGHEGWSAVVKGCDVTGCLRPVAWSGTQLYAAGASGVLHTVGSDGSVTGSRLLPAGPAHWTALAGDGAVIVAGLKGLCAVSADGKTSWTCLKPSRADSRVEVAGDGTVYFLDDKVYAFDPKGSLKWKADLPAPVQDSVIYGGILFAFADGSLCAVTPDGRLAQWRPGEPLGGAPAAGDRKVIFINGDIGLMLHTDRGLYTVDLTFMRR